jgi:ferredoxin
MPRVVVKRNDGSLQDAADSCPIGCIQKVGNEFVIDPNQCIDCGVCQSIVDEGVILEDSEADPEDAEYNAKNAK